MGKESGVINGIPFVRAETTEHVQSGTGFDVRGMIYVGRDGLTVIAIRVFDVQGAFDESSKLGTAAILTFRKKGAADTARPTDSGRPPEGASSPVHVAASMPIWQPDPTVLDELEPYQDVEDYQIRLPKGCETVPTPQNVPYSKSWRGEDRRQQTAADSG